MKKVNAMANAIVILSVIIIGIVAYLSKQPVMAVLAAAMLASHLIGIKWRLSRVIAVILFVVVAIQSLFTGDYVLAGLMGSCAAIISISVFFG